MTILHSLFSGLLSGLEKQSEMTELLDELYYDGLLQPAPKKGRGRGGRHRAG